MTDPAHPDPQTLAEHLEGLLEPARAATVAAHLDECESCVAVAAELGDVSRALRAAADVGPLPELVAHRIERAIAAEPPLEASPARPAAAAAQGRAGPALDRRARRSRRRGGRGRRRRHGGTAVRRHRHLRWQRGGRRRAAGRRRAGARCRERARGPAPPATADSALLHRLAAAAATSRVPAEAAVGGCSLEHVDGVPGRVVSTLPATRGDVPVVVVTLRRSGGASAVVLASCHPAADGAGAGRRALTGTPVGNAAGPTIAAGSTSPIPRQPPPASRKGRSVTDHVTYACPTS